LVGSIKLQVPSAKKHYKRDYVLQKRPMILGKTGVTAGRDKIEFRLFNSSSIFNITLREELFSVPKKNQTCYLVLVSWR